MRYRPEIDGLRAVAVLPVIFFHAGFVHFSGGFVGVDVFFVISGYLITSIILNDIDAGTFSLTGFYERRVRRILPALFLVMLVSLPFAWACLLPVDMKSFAQSVAAVPVFASNILFWLGSGYFETPDDMQPLLHTWSLAVEEQYYIVFPLLLLLAGRMRALWFVLLAVLVTSFGAAHWASYNKPDAAFYLLPMRAWELMIGALAALYLRSGKSISSSLINQVLSLSGLVLIFYAVFVFDKTIPFPGVFALAPTLGTLLVILCAVPGTLVHRALGLRLLVGIGLISYSAYLWHYPLFVFARYVHIDPLSIPVLFALCGVTFLLSYLSWRFVEQPFRDRSNFSRASVFRIAFAVACCFVVFGLSVNAADGVYSRFDSRLEEAQKSAMRSPKSESCMNTEEACRYFVEQPSWAVFGDSHAIELAYALAERLRESDDGVAQYSHTGCKPSYGNEADDQCSKWTRKAIGEIIHDPQLKNVVVSYRIAAFLFGSHMGKYPEFPNETGDEEKERIWRSYVELLADLVAADKNVYLVMQAPELKRHVNVLMRALKGGGGNATVSGVPREWWERRIAFVTVRLGDIPARVRIINPAEKFCDDTDCYAIKDGQSLYVDFDHVSVNGASVIADMILDQRP